MSEFNNDCVYKLIYAKAKFVSNFAKLTRVAVLAGWLFVIEQAISLATFVLHFMAGG